ncbi:hypothetical protein ACJX0J_031602, partial [Zea mays]
MTTQVSLCFLPKCYCYFHFYSFSLLNAGAREGKPLILKRTKIPLETWTATGAAMAHHGAAAAATTAKETSSFPFLVDKFIIFFVADPDALYFVNGNWHEEIYVFCTRLDIPLLLATQIKVNGDSSTRYSGDL